MLLFSFLYMELRGTIIYAFEDRMWDMLVSLEIFLEVYQLFTCEELPEPERSIFQRHYFLYQKTDEIAEALQLNSATVRTKLARGREKLRQTLIEGGYRCEG